MYRYPHHVSPRKRTGRAGPASDAQSASRLHRGRAAPCGRSTPRWPLALPGSLLLSGCATQQPPYVVLFESYFPSWIVCAVVGCIGSLLIRLILVRAGIDECIPLRTLVYMTLALGLTFATSLLVFVR